MKAVVFYEMAPGKTKEDAMVIYTSHKAVFTGDLALAFSLSRFRPLT